MSIAPQYGRGRSLASVTVQAPSTPHQRLYARTLMEQAGMSALLTDARHVELLARIPTKVAVGRSIDAVLRDLTRGEIATLIDLLIAATQPTAQEHA